MNVDQMLPFEPASQPNPGDATAMTGSVQEASFPVIAVSVLCALCSGALLWRVAHLRPARHEARVRGRGAGRRRGRLAPAALPGDQVPHGDPSVPHQSHLRGVAHRRVHVLAFKTRKIPENFNESKFIGWVPCQHKSLVQRVIIYQHSG